MVLTGIREMEMQEFPMPVIQNETDVLIKMKVVGICGSDVHYYKSEGRLYNTLSRSAMKVRVR